MKWILLTLALMVSAVQADTYLYRVHNNSYPINSFSLFLSTFGSKDQGQPFQNSYVLNQGNTMYYLIKMTPQDLLEQKFLNERSLEKLGGIDLYQVYEMRQDGPFLKIDNSKLYSTQWSVKHSS